MIKFDLALLRKFSNLNSKIKIQKIIFVFAQKDKIIHQLNQLIKQLQIALMYFLKHLITLIIKENNIL